MPTTDGSFFNWQAISAIAAAAAALIGVVVAVFLHRAERRIQALDAFDNYRRELLDFTKDVVATMSRAEVLTKTDPTKSPDPDVARQRFFEERVALMSHLSSLVDRGRFFFPNYEAGRVGSGKSPANQGLRDPVLNRILAAHKCVKALDYTHHQKNAEKRCLDPADKKPDDEWLGDELIRALSFLSPQERQRVRELAESKGVTPLDLIIAAKRSFVSEVFSVIQPRDWLRNVERCYGLRLRSRQPESTTPIHTGRHTETRASARSVE